MPNLGLAPPLAVQMEVRQQNATQDQVSVDPKKQWPYFSAASMAPRSSVLSGVTPLL